MHLCLPFTPFLHHEAPCLGSHCAFLPVTVAVTGQKSGTSDNSSWDYAVSLLGAVFFRVVCRTDKLGGWGQITVLTSHYARSYSTK